MQGDAGMNDTFDNEQDDKQILEVFERLRLRAKKANEEARKNRLTDRPET